MPEPATPSRQIAISAVSVRDLSALIERIVAGQSLDGFVRAFHDHAARHEWSWLALDSRRGFRRQARLFYCAISSIRHAQHRRQQLDDSAYGWRIFKSGVDCPASHRALDGMTLPADHRFWAVYRLPLDWDCGCYVLGARSERGIARLGGILGAALPDGWDRIDPETGNVPGVRPSWAGDTPPDPLTLLAAIVDGEIDDRR